jgi:fido (protein-threonine AMPylation protein)
MEDFCDEVNSRLASQSTDSASIVAFVLSQTVWIHPFRDGNGR